MLRTASGPIRLLLLAAVVTAAAAQNLPPPPGHSPPPPDPQALARVALGLIEYTRWPGPPRDHLLCLATSRGFGRDVQAALRAEPERLPRWLPRELPINAPPPDECDALVMAGWDDGAARQALSALVGRPVLVIGLGAHSCDQGAQFCLLLPRPPQAPPGDMSATPPGPPNGPRFSSNLDAIRRSGLIVSSRVMQLARPLEPRP